MRSKHYIDAHMRLHAGAVHIWAADLDAVDTQIERLLDEQERERGARIVREPVRQRWMAARGVLRVLLGNYLHEHPSALRFAREARGKPMLDLPGGGRLRFNLSHSGGLAVYALTEMCAVGVDVELVDRRMGAVGRPDEVALAQRVLGSATAERLRKLDPQPHRQDFLRAWVRHEAEGKRLGVGARHEAEGRRLGVGVRNSPVQARMRGSRPWIAELDLGRDAVGAVALAVAPVDFQVYAIDFRACGSILPVSTIMTHHDEPNVSKYS
jgi:4'-phosphopantetheinyl transferase